MGEGEESELLCFRFYNRMSTKVEVTRGVFDPRTYREADPNNAARKRRSDWLAIPGKIHYVRERTVASEERELVEQVKKAEEEKEQPREEVVEVFLSPFLGKSLGSFLPNPLVSFHSFICSSLNFLCLLQASINLLTPLTFFCFFLSIFPTSKSSLPNCELFRNSAKTSLLLFPP